jgi:hypothetical protein
MNLDRLSTASFGDLLTPDFQVYIFVGKMGNPNKEKR